jgi:hypothetical protein
VIPKEITLLDLGSSILINFVLQGIVTLGFAGVKNYGSVLALRLLIGVVSSSYLALL